MQSGPDPEPDATWFRVHSRYDDGREVPYSWPVNYWDEGGNLAGSGLCRAVVYRTTISDITFLSECDLGHDYPAAENIGVVVDFNRDGVFEPARRCAVDDEGRLTGWYCEAMPFKARFMGVNNRVQSTVWGGLIVGRDSPEWIASVNERIAACLEKGFNGVTVDRDPVNTDRKLETADLVYHEFFYSAPRSLQPPGTTVRDLGAALWRTANGHEVDLAVALVVDESGAGLAENLKGTIGNVPDRLNPFALYLLISKANLFFWVEAAVGGPYQWFNLLPEWKVPLGEPLIEQPTRAGSTAGQCRRSVRDPGD